MKSLLQAALLACAAMALSGPVSRPAQAQLFDFDDDKPRARQQASRPGVARPNQSRPQKAKSYGTPWQAWNDDDDDDDRPQRGVASNAGTRQLNHSIVQGGPRPNISPATPPTVSFSGYAPGNVVIDSGGRALYYVLGGNRAYRYPIAVGREGFAWTGTEKVSRKAAWPDWIPPTDMRQRDPRLPERMTGGLNNPLGAHAIYLGNTLYRIHGTNNANSIGSASSSGCFRMNNSHVQHLASLVSVGATVHVVKRLPATARRVAGL